MVDSRSVFPRLLGIVPTPSICCVRISQLRFFFLFECAQDVNEGLFGCDGNVRKECVGRKVQYLAEWPARYAIRSAHLFQGGQANSQLLGYGFLWHGEVF